MNHDDKMSGQLPGCYPALSRHPKTDAGMWGAGRKGLAAQDRMMSGCRVSYPALSRDPTTDAGTRRAGRVASYTGQDADRMLGQLPESTRNRSWDDTRMIGIRAQKLFFMIKMI